MRPRPKALGLQKGVPQASFLDLGISPLRKNCLKNWFELLNGTRKESTFLWIANHEAPTGAQFLPRTNHALNGELPLQVLDGRRLNHDSKGF